ncbi:OLC1v1014917C2 [Oldenlandia corymbosa var. corymbosa]|nr:OLC1v1014917C2 [Oldenlandia corymbosa var. corymbosa]
MHMTYADRVIWIDLLARTRGTQSAEMYFNGLQESDKTREAYGVLLHCYCRAKKLDKALELFGKMKELDYTSTWGYNSLASLFLGTMPEQIPLLVQEMEQKKLNADIATYDLLILSYGAQKDFGACEKVLEDMQKKDVKCEWTIYASLAAIYAYAGIHSKAAEFIHKMEMENACDRNYFHNLLGLYKDMKDVSGVYRTWNALKSIFPIPNNDDYLLMMCILSELSSLENLETWFKSWESGQFFEYDVRITNVVLEAYLLRDMIQKAKAFYKSMVAKGYDPNLRTMELLTRIYMKNYQIKPALKYLEMGSAMVTREQDQWFPQPETIKIFLEYFEGREDWDRAEKFCNILKKLKKIPS